jgi:hypothetical protein
LTPPFDAHAHAHARGAARRYAALLLLLLLRWTMRFSVLVTEARTSGAAAAARI